MKGTIFEIREFCLQDGPGVRTTVFFKGCPLRCSWCHNPEGLSRDIETMRGQPCGRVVEASELAGELHKGDDFFQRFGGGITFSGGEPFAQIDFLLELASLLKPLHLVAETSGFVSPADYKRGAAAVDILYQDLKHWNADAFSTHCKGDLSLVMDNLTWLKQSNVPHVIRIPLIPGVNDLPGYEESFASLLNGDKALQRVELLPYHVTASVKYELMNKPYKPTFDPSAEIRKPDLDIFKQHNIQAVLA